MMRLGLMRLLRLMRLGSLVVVSGVLVLCALILSVPTGTLPTGHPGAVVQYSVAFGLMLLSLIWLLAFIVALWRRKRIPGPRSWLAVHIIVIAAGAAVLQWWPQWSGFVVAGVFIALVVVPNVLLQIAKDRAGMRHMRAAVLYGRLASLFHPAKWLRCWVAYLQAESRGTIEEKLDALRVWAAHTMPAEIAVINACIFQVQDDWGSALEATRRVPDASANLKVLEIRSLGELGRVDEMVQTYAAAEAALTGRDLHFCRLYVLAFSGCVDGVGDLLSRGLSRLAAERKSYWSAIALKSSGTDDESWRRALATFARMTKDETARRAAERHLAPDRGSVVLSPESIGTIAAVEQQLLSSRRTRRRQVPVTVILMALIVAAFAVEQLHGGANDRNTLVDLGALTAPLVLRDGQWWRLVVAPFLDYGWFHLLLNLYLLLAIGVPYEAKSTRRQILAVYGFGVLASLSIALFTLSKSTGGGSLFVGASGAIFALVGSVVGRLLREWSRAREALDWRGWTSMDSPRYWVRLVFIIVLLWIDLGFELHELSISYAVHAAGFAAGLAMSVALGRQMSTAQFAVR